MILDNILENFEDESILLIDGFDSAILGIEESTMRLIYSKRKIIKQLSKEMNETDAIEFFYFNIESGYVGEKTPIFCNDYL